MRPEQLIDPITSRELGIQENDLWLCAQAVAHDMVLVTNDTMRRIREVSQGMQPALLIQNWAVQKRGQGRVGYRPRQRCDTRIDS